METLIVDTGQGDWKWNGTLQ